MKKCPFCNWQDREDLIFESDNFIFFKSKFRITKSHCLLVPKNHYRNEIDIPPKLWHEFMQNCVRAYNYIEKKYKKPPFTFVNAPQQQSVLHYHRHYLAGVFEIHGVAKALQNWLKEINKANLIEYPY
jgi:diadenosine tetraphosphate (Ap4A) HIT family hydrolase